MDEQPLAGAPLEAVPHAPAEPPEVIVLQLATVLALVLANAFFVASEFALVSVRRTRIDQLAAEGSSAALVVQRAVRELDRYVAATQVGITVASLLLGGLGERALEPLLAPLFAWMPAHWLGLTRAGVAAGLAYFIMTALHVVIGELMPKSIALQKPDVTALWIARPMAFCAWLFTPLIWMLNGTGNFLLRRIGFHPAEGHEQVHTPAELDLIFAHSHEGGELNATEFEMLHRVVRFSDIAARAVMVPRVEIQAVPLALTRDALVRLLRDGTHTRLPVTRGTLDDIIGVVAAKDLERLQAHLLTQELELLKAALAGAGTPESGGVLPPLPTAPLDLAPLVRDVPHVPETMTIDRLLNEFKRSRQQMAIVIDEFGGTAGLVTLGDLLEQVFGDMPESHATAPDIEEQPAGIVRLAGRVPIAEMNERYGLGLPTDEADTVAGLVLSALGRPAAVGDTVEIRGVRLRVEAIDRLRITSLSLFLPSAVAQAVV